MQFSENTYQNNRHKTFYLSAGEENNKKIYFIHGWPELSISWRNQLGFFSNLGFHAIAPDMRGYGQSSIYDKHADYCQEEIVKDMIELHTHLGGGEAIWVGHDWGSPVVWNIACHHDEYVEKIVSLCVPFKMMENDNMLSSIDRQLYPEDEFPYGQWEYQIFYRENFDKAKQSLEDNPRNTVKCLFRSGNAENLGKRSNTAFVRKNNGWFKNGIAPDIALDESVLSRKELEIYSKYLSENGFFGPGSWYMNTELNNEYNKKAPLQKLKKPTLFIHAKYDRVCDTCHTSLADSMRENCSNLKEATIESGHWMAQEKPDDVNKTIKEWLAI